MMDVTQDHPLVETLVVRVNTPGHDPRVSTPLFLHTREHLLQRDGARCWVCRCTAAEVGHPLEAHHYPIERSFADMIDWAPGSLIRQEFPGFAWGTFDIGAATVDGIYTPRDVYMFVDDMNVNGRLLCKPHHTGADEGVHAVPEPVFLAQKYGRDGFKFSDIEIIHHGKEGAP